jgi:hypothetical protein
MWSYYGAKTNIIDLYPKQKHDLIIEPFAGTARYALKYFDRNVLLVDKYDVIVDIWKYLQECSVKDVLETPRFKFGERFDTHKFDCTAQMNFTSFVHGCGDSKPRTIPTKRKTIDRPNHVNFTLKRISENLHKIRHWKIELGEYENIPNQTATWFIDPPYQFGGEAYAFSNKKIDYKKLANWCVSRPGQIIVCENIKANWLNFKPIIQQRGSIKKGTETIWSNMQTDYDNVQTSLF